MTWYRGVLEFYGVHWVSYGSSSIYRWDKNSFYSVVPFFFWIYGRTLATLSPLFQYGVVYRTCTHGIEVLQLSNNNAETKLIAATEKQKSYIPFIHDLTQSIEGSRIVGVELNLGTRRRSGSSATVP